MKKHKNVIEGIIIIAIIIGICLLIFPMRDIKSTTPINIVYIPKSIDETNEFWMALISGVKMASKEYNVNLTALAPKQEVDYEEQNKLIQEAIDKKPDAIMLSPLSYTENTNMAKEIKKNGIKLVFIDSEVNEDIADCIVSTDNFIAGEKMGSCMKKQLKEDTKIAVVSHVKTTSTAIDREKGVRYGLGSDENKIIEVVYSDSMYDKASNLTKELMEKYPDITMIAGFNEYSSVGAANAIKELGLEKQVKIVGFDNSLEEVELLEEGVFDSIVIQKPFNMGYFGLEQAVKLAKGEKCSKYLDSGSELITKENMYTTENQKMLFPFVGRQFREIKK